MTTGVDTVRQLRERTGAGIMDCKAALQASNGDMEKAVDFLRKKGVASAAKRAGREAKQGLIGASVKAPVAVIVEANCETDFVARTDDFKQLLLLAIDQVFERGENALGEKAVSDRVAELSGKIGEKIVVSRAKRIRSSGGVIFLYIHANQKLGVLVELAASRDASKTNAAFEALGKDLAMQVAASNPIGISRGDISPALVERERAIFREEVKGKPDNIVEKIMAGKLEKYYQTVCLLEQPYVKDDKRTIQSVIGDVDRQLQDKVQVKQFVRFQLGESV